MAGTRSTQFFVSSNQSSTKSEIFLTSNNRKSRNETGKSILLINLIKFKRDIR